MYYADSRFEAASAPGPTFIIQLLRLRFLNNTLPLGSGRMFRARYTFFGRDSGAVARGLEVVVEQDVRDDGLELVHRKETSGAGKAGCESQLQCLPGICPVKGRRRTMHACRGRRR